MRLAVSIQHHPARPDLPTRLVSMLDHGLSECRKVAESITVIEDPSPFAPSSPWRGYQACCAATPDWATHHLILQDDVLPCPSFIWAVGQTIERSPGTIIAYYTSHFPPSWGSQIRNAADRCETGVELIPDPWIPCLALCYPAEMTRDLAGFTPRDPRRAHIADDETIGDWSRARGIRSFLATVPSLVQHDDEQISCLLGHREARVRQALCWIGHYSARDVNWSRFPQL